MGDFIELDPVDHLAAGALGVPGQRTFLIQARRGATEVVVLVEKDQVAMLASEAGAFLDRVAEEYPEVEGIGAASMGVDADLDEPGDPMFRAQLIGLGFDPQRDLVLLELRERPPAEEAEEGDGPGEPEADEGLLVRCHVTRAQVRAMAVRALEVVAAGRPLCPLCEFPMDPAGHICPRWN